jgi:phage head maturation protease
MAEWDSAYINNLPDSAFAYIESGGEKDEEGKTVPRSLRHYPHHDSSGAVDLPHLRNALSRVAQEATTSQGRGHLEAHAKNEGVGTRTLDIESVITVRSESARELDMRIMPWGRMIETTEGMETFERGAFDGTDPTSVRHWGLEHEVHLGIGQMGEPVVTRHPVGRGVATSNEEDGQHLTTKLARTSRADEVLALAADKIASGVSIEFIEIPGGTVTETRNGRRTKVHKQVRLTGVSTTYRPAYGEEAAVLAVRSQGGDPVAETTPAPVEPTPPPAPVLDAVQIGSTIATEVGKQLEAAIEATRARSAITDETAAKFLERLEALEERTRMSISIPSKVESGHPDDFHRGDWLKMVLRTLTGETVSQAELQARVAADLITADNLGVIPTAYLNEIIGIIDPARPFLETTTKIQTPRAGMTLSVPKIVTRPTTGVQDPEKEELTSTPTSIVPATFDPVTVGGYGDISIQLLKRSDPSYLSMYLDLLAEAYAIDADDLAVDALLAASGVHSGGTVDPDDGPLFGDAWANAAAVSRRITPDTIWLATAAVAAFINAKSTTTNAPLYGNLAAAFSANRGVGGTISGLRPVHVPALDDENVDAIVGPSRGFVWAEDGTYTLQVDVPAKAGRDVGIVGMLWFAPLYPAAFTKYVVTS